MDRRKSRPAVVLLVEDDAGDQELIRRVLTEDGFHVDLRIVSDGEEALDYLNRRGRYEAPHRAPMPDLMLLDLNTPKLDGRDVLKAIRSDPRLARLAVVVLTTSKLESDIVKSYQLGCNSFITKPVEIDDFIRTIGQLGSYWFELVTLPEPV